MALRAVWMALNGVYCFFLFFFAPIVLDQSFFPSNQQSGSDDVASIRANADFFIVYPTNERQERSLLSSLSSGKKFRDLQILLQHSLLGSASTYSKPSDDFRISKPCLLISNCPETSPFFRIRESLNNTRPSDGLRLPFSVLNLKKGSHGNGEIEEERKAEEKEEEEEAESRGTESKKEAGNKKESS